MRIKAFILTFAALGLAGCGGDKIDTVARTWEVNCTTNEIRRIANDPGSAFLNKNKWYSKNEFVAAGTPAWNDRELAALHFTNIKRQSKCN